MIMSGMSLMLLENRLSYTREAKTCACRYWARSPEQMLKTGGHHPACPMEHAEWCRCLHCSFSEDLPRVVRGRGLGTIEENKW